MSSNCKLFANDTSLFSVVNDIQSITATLCNDLTAISNWSFQWKMIFKPDLAKQAQKVIFSSKVKKLLHPSLSFNCIYTDTIFSYKTIKSSEQFGRQYKHLDVLLDEQIRIQFRHLMKHGDGQKNYLNDQIQTIKSV